MDGVIKAGKSQPHLQPGQFASHFDSGENQAYGESYCHTDDDLLDHYQ